MTVKDILGKIENGSAHIILIKNSTGEVILSTIWHNIILDKYLNKEVKHIYVKDYELRLMI